MNSLSNHRSVRGREISLCQKSPQTPKQTKKPKPTNKNTPQLAKDMVRDFIKALCKINMIWRQKLNWKWCCRKPKEYKKQAVKNEIVLAEHANQGDWVTQQERTAESTHYAKLDVWFSYGKLLRGKKRDVFGMDSLHRENSSLQTLCEHTLKTDK